MTSRHSTTIPRSDTGFTDVAPTRSRTDPPAHRSDKERSHLHRRLHHANTMTGKDSHPQHRHRHRDRAKDTVQSAIDLKPPISFDQLLRRDRKSPLTGRHESPSQQQRDIEEWQVQQQIQQEREARARVTAQDVEKLKAENEKREQELARSLKEVEDMGMSSTRQLDDTYYAILEKASILRSTVASLQQLADESRRMHQQFKDDSGALETDTRENLDHFNNFEEQEKTINELVTKLQSSKDETNKLNERLEKARTRIETYEQKQEAHRAKRRKQWHAVGGTLLGVVLLVVMALLLRHRRDVAAQMGVVGQKLAAAGDVVYGAGSNLTKDSPPEDPYLRQLFDEL